MSAIRLPLSILVLSLVAAPSSALVKPKILIVFDTSGSMLASGDGSELCGGSGTASRMYQLKQAFFQVLQGIGAQEVDFGLATFPMMVDPSMTPKCYNQCYEPATNFSLCSGHYRVDPSQDSEHSTASTKLHGCKVSSHSPLMQQSASCGDPTNPCGAWYPEFETEVLKVPFAGTTPEAMMIYFDQKEDPTPVPFLQNPEVRAGNWWYTPLGKSLFYAHGYFHKEVLSSIVSYEKPCTKLVVALFTDGSETCNELASDPFYPTTWASKLSSLGITVHTVAIDFSNSLLSSIAASGGGNYYPVGGNTAALKQAFLDIIAKALPPSESCNGLDDDCDNQVDEDFPLKGTPCNSGKLGLCFASGTYVCNASGSGVVCNAPNISGTTEICNGLDDNCNGQIDEIPGCIPCVPQPEICNGKDDDCDGKTDEDFVSTPCGKDLGECLPGQTACLGGKIVCQGGSAGTAEVCNGLDDDCDGLRDGMSEACYTFASGCTLVSNQWVCSGFCKAGMRICTAVQTGGSHAGVWSSCVGQVGPAKEVCNGQDDDCDGVVDETAECPAGTQCQSGQCVTPCGAGEFICPKGQICDDGWCIKDPCDAAACAAQGGACKGGQCIDLCQGVTCPGKYDRCIKGACVDTSCYNPTHACSSGQRCIQGACAPDPCAQVSCGDDEYCNNGRCLRMCDTLQCPPGQSCELRGGVVGCVDDPCADQVCASPFICVDGTCHIDPCNTTNCSTSEVCIQGTCVADPCERVRCPAHAVCEAGMCHGDAVKQTEMLASGSGGLACSLSVGAPTPPLLTLLLIGLCLAIRRRG